MAVIHFVAVILSLNSVIGDNCFEPNTEYYGTNMNDASTQKTETAENCQTLCCNVMGCVGFTWTSGDFPGTLGLIIYNRYFGLRLMKKYWTPMDFYKKIRRSLVFSQKNS